MHSHESRLPCSSSSLGGSISTMLIYGYCLLQGANLLSDGSEMLLEVLDPGLIGGAPSAAPIACPGGSELAPSNESERVRLLSSAAQAAS